MRFLKLKDIVINTSHIKYIKIQPNTYVINLGHYNYGGFFMGTGPINCNPNNITVCNTQDPEEYNIVNQWLATLKNDGGA